MREMVRKVSAASQSSSCTRAAGSSLGRTHPAGSLASVAKKISLMRQRFIGPGLSKVNHKLYAYARAEDSWCSSTQRQRVLPFCCDTELVLLGNLGDELDRTVRSCHGSGARWVRNAAEQEPPRSRGGERPGGGVRLQRNLFLSATRASGNKDIKTRRPRPPALPPSSPGSGSCATRQLRARGQRQPAPGPAGSGRRPRAAAAALPSAAGGGAAREPLEPSAPRESPVDRGLLARTAARGRQEREEAPASTAPARADTPLPGRRLRSAAGSAIPHPGTPRRGGTTPATGARRTPPRRGPPPPKTGLADREGCQGSLEPTPRAARPGPSPVTAAPHRRAVRPSHAGGCGQAAARSRERSPGPGRP